MRMNVVSMLIKFHLMLIQSVEQICIQIIADNIVLNIKIILYKSIQKAGIMVVLVCVF
jgi:hypothetical protein